MAPELHGRVRRLFDQALEQPEAGRLTFLQSACPEDPGALEEVVRLLEAHANSKSFLEDNSRIPRRIGRYLITGELGRGAMGIVYEAADPVIGRRLAVKVIHLPDCADAAKAEFLREGLFREARSAGALSHPGIVVIFDVGQAGDMAFIAMERVEGTSLHQMLASGQKIPAELALDILRQAAAALDYAHRNGVVHRDIKPANIMLDGGTRVKIADFGIAKITSTEFSTLTGGVIGTPSYMSPEQFESRPSDARSDQFSLAVLAYELLTGRRPFESDSLAALAHMVVNLDRPSAHASNPELPAALDPVFRRGLARDPGGRYSSCTRLVSALDEAWTHAGDPEGNRKADSIGPLPASHFPPAGSMRGPTESGGPNRVSGSRMSLRVAGAALLALAAGAAVYMAGNRGRTSPPNISAVDAPAPVVAQFVAEPPSIPAGSVATLRWDVRGASEVLLDQGIGKVGASGTIEVRPSQAITYMIEATGPGGKATARTQVNVTAASPANEERARQLCMDAESKWRALQHSRARALYRQAAALGDAPCMDRLGEIVMDDNPTEALQWFRKAAEAGNPSGMLHLGGLFELGFGVLEDYDLAAFWYGKATEAGNADAMYNLGRLRESGQGVPRDLKKADSLYGRSAALGNADAKEKLAQMNRNRE